MEYAIETFSLTKIFSDWWGRNKIYAVDDLNLQIRNNEVFGLLGPNGSGKTTTLKMLLGLLHPTKGRSLLLGGDSTNTAINAKIGFMPEESYLYRYLNARETLDFYGSLFALPAKIRKSRTETLLEMVGLKAMANRAVGTYSKGMARRIGLAQALINDPELLILDEPTTGLDPIGTRQIKDLILQLAKRGKTILLCSHLLADVEDVCDRIAILYSGKIQSEGKVAELLQQTDKKQITVADVSDAAVEKIKHIIDAENGKCLITSPMEKLESFFVKTVQAAQAIDQTVSGAVSTTNIGDFLVSESAEQKTASDILDKLVTPAEPKKPTTKQPPKTAPPAPIETSQPDKNLLEELVEPTKTSTAKTQTAEPKPTPSRKQDAEKVDKSVLEQLTDNHSDKQNKNPTADTQGEPSDA